MSDLIPSNFGMSRLERSASRQISAVRARQAVLTTRETAKIETLADIGEAGLMAAARVSSVEAMLAAQFPHAAGRLAAIGDAAALNVVETVMKAGRSVR